MPLRISMPEWPAPVELQKLNYFLSKRPKKCEFSRLYGLSVVIWLRQFSYFVDFLEVLDHMATSTATGKKRMTQSDVLTTSRNARK